MAEPTAQEAAERTLVHYEVRDGVAYLTLDDPPANTYTYEMMRQLDDAILRARFDDDVHVIVLRGMGEKFFCAGADISMLQKAEPRFKYYFCLHANETLNRLEQTPKLVIAALNGHTVGGGLEIAMAADLRIAKQGGGKVGLPEVTLGVLPGTGGTQRLARLVGKSRAIELMVTGDLLASRRRASLGLVNRIFDGDDFDERGARVRAPVLPARPRLARRSAASSARCSRAPRCPSRAASPSSASCSSSSSRATTPARGSTPTSASASRASPGAGPDRGARPSPTPMSEFVLAAPVRTPIGRFRRRADGAVRGRSRHRGRRPPACDRAGCPPARVDEVIFGHARQAGGGPNAARQIALPRRRARRRPRLHRQQGLRLGPAGGAARRREPIAAGRGAAWCSPAAPRACPTRRTCCRGCAGATGWGTRRAGRRHVPGRLRRPAVGAGDGRDRRGAGRRGRHRARGRRTATPLESQRRASGRREARALRGRDRAGRVSRRRKGAPPTSSPPTSTRATASPPSRWPS